MTLRISSSSTPFLVAAVAVAYAISSVNGFTVAYPNPTTRTTTTSALASGWNNPLHISFSSPFIFRFREVTTQLSSSINDNDNNIDKDITTIRTRGKEQEEVEENLTSVGSYEYYQGFLTRSPNKEPIERVTGDAILGPTLKFAGGISFILVVFVLVFLGSNGLLL